MLRALRRIGVTPASDLVFRASIHASVQEHACLCSLQVQATSLQSVAITHSTTFGYDVTKPRQPCNIVLPLTPLARGSLIPFLRQAAFDISASQHVSYSTAADTSQATKAEQTTNAEQTAKAEPEPQPSNTSGTPKPDEAEEPPPADCCIVVERNEKGMKFYLPAQGLKSFSGSVLALGSIFTGGALSVLAYMLLHGIYLYSLIMLPVMYLGLTICRQALLMACVEEQLQLDVAGDKYSIMKIMRPPMFPPKLFSLVEGTLSTLGYSTVVCPVELPKWVVGVDALNALQFNDGEKDVYMGVFIPPEDQDWLARQVNAVLAMLERPSEADGAVEGGETQVRLGRWMRHLRRTEEQKRMAEEAELAAASVTWEDLAAPPKMEKLEIGSGKIVSR